MLLRIVADARAWPDFDLALQRRHLSQGAVDQGVGLDGGAAEVVGDQVGDLALVYDWCFDLLDEAQRGRWLAYAKANRLYWEAIFIYDTKEKKLDQATSGFYNDSYPAFDPEGKYLVHSFVESPDMMNVYNGNVVLDERGTQATTRELAAWLQGWMAEGVSPAFVIGGADGLDDGVKARAARLLGLSKLTLPHALARVMLAEQLYRAVCIIKGHPYHRD